MSELSALAPDELDPTTWAVLRALRSGAPLSRNKHFDLFEDARVRKAIRLHRFLESIVRDVERCGEDALVQVVERAGDQRYALRVDFPRVHGHRTVYLSQFEMRLLGEHDAAVARLLSDLLDGPRPPR